jgi:acetyl/propionyl-CoA carboxylase alpha subunit
LQSAVRAKLLEAAVNGANALGYTSAGTLEFLVSGDNFYFLEVNTRVQVEHPITEMVTGIDIVKEQISIAFGNPLSFSQDQVQPRGHAIEFRINAEDPFKNFMPCPGTISDYIEPRLPWLRIDTACYSGYQILPFYDSLLAKLIVWGRDRQEAIARGLLALRDYKIAGVPTTIPFHIALLQDEIFQLGQVDTKYVESIFMKRFPQESAAARQPVEPVLQKRPSPSEAVDGNREQIDGGSTGHKLPARTFEVEFNQKRFKVSVSEVVHSPENSDSYGVSSSGIAFGIALNNGLTSLSGGSQTARRVLGKRTSVSRDEQTASTTGLDAQSSVATMTNSGQVRAQMHGLVKEIFVKEGQSVQRGDKLLILEAMKMESEVVAPLAGKVLELAVKVGDVVESGMTFLRLQSQ